MEDEIKARQVPKGRASMKNGVFSGADEVAERVSPFLPVAGEAVKHAPAGFKSERDLLTGILGAMSDAIFLIDSEFNFDYANPVAEKVFGPVSGRKCHEYFQNRSDVCPWCEREKIVGGPGRRRIYKEVKSEKIYDVFEAPIKIPDGRISKLAVLHDITRHRKAEKFLRLDEARFDALVKLSRMSGEPAETARFALEQAVRLTRSKIGFIGFLDAGESFVTCLVTAGKGGEKCETVSKSPFRIAESPVWAEAVRRRKPVFVDNFTGSGKETGPLPFGRRKLSRHLTIPFIHGGRVVSVATVANKRENYDDWDARQFILLMDSMWKLIQRERDREKLRDSERRMRFLAARLLDFIEEERARVANEIHSNIGQMLAAMKFWAENALKAAESGSLDKTVPLLESWVGMLKDGVGNARDIYMNLRPTVLDDFGVVAAVFWLCARFQEKNPHILVDKDLDVEESEIPNRLKLPIFRVIQEALDNSAAHSGAERVRLALQRDDDTLEMSFTDNGEGFDLSILSADGIKKGFGLATMRERTQLSGGSFHIDSIKGEGTMLKAVWKVGEPD